MVLNAGITGVKRDEFSLGPGIVGHLVVDVAYVAVPLYALLIGLALRYIDQRVQLHPGNPFIVIPFGAAAAQVLAFPRGELGLFAFNALAWIVGAIIALKVLGFVVARRTAPEGEEGDGDEDGDGDGSDADEHAPCAHADREHARA
jgi:hypothetical protein